MTLLRIPGKFTLSAGWPWFGFRTPRTFFAASLKPDRKNTVTLARGKKILLLW